MKKKYVWLVFFFCCLFITGACMQYQTGQIPFGQIPSLPVRGADLYPQQQNKNGLIVAVDDYFDPEKSNQTFDMNFTDENILVIEIIVSNRSDNVYNIQKDEVFLLYDGRVIYPVPLSKLELPKKKGGYFQFLELKDLVINPGENKNGFLYFQILRQEEQPYFTPVWSSDYKVRLAATKMNDGDDNRLIYTIVLRNF